LKPPLPPDEKERLEVLRSLKILDTKPESAFDELVALAAALCDVPISLVSLVDEDRQWFKASVGIDARETPREVAFCAHAILQDLIFEIPDTSLDERFATNPLVTGAPKIRFYAGMPLRTTDGHNMGTLCVAGHEPRTLTEAQRTILQTLARAVTSQLELRRALARADQLNDERLRVERELLESTDLLGALTSIASTALADLDLRKAFDRTLSLLLVATGSEFGFIGESITKSGNRTSLHVHAFADTPHGLFARGMDEADCFTRLFDVVGSAGGPIISNSPLNDPRFECLGPKRVHIRSFLGVPLRSGAELSGMVGLGNANAGYVPSITAKILPILATCASIIGSIRIERQRLVAEDALRISEERYRQLVDSSLDAIIGVDEVGAIVSWNPQAEAIFGWTAEEAVGQLLAKMIIPEEERGKYLERGGSALLTARGEKGASTRTEVVALRRGGHRFPAEIAVSAFPSLQGTGYAVFLRDLTELEESERAVMKSEQRLRQTLSAAKAGAWEWDFVRERGFWSDEDYRLLGYEPGSIEPSLDALLAHIHPDDREGAVATIEGAVASGTPFEYDYRIVRPDGDFRWIRDVGDVEFDDAGRPLRVSGIVTDITERKTAELELAETSSRLAVLIQNLDAGILVEDETRRIRLANRELCRQFGIQADPEDLVGSDCAAATRDLADQFGDPQRFLQEIEQTLAAKTPIRAAVVRMKDGRVFERDFVPIRIGEASIGHLWQYRDVTARETARRRLLEQSNQLSTANAQLERAGRLKDEFLAAMSHELRTPLNAVLGLAEGLHAGVFGPLAEEQAQQVAVIEDSGRHLLELINDILDLSKIGAGKLDLTLAPVVPSAICDASLRMVRETALRKQIRLTSAYDPDLTLVVADSLRLRQILVNLLSNAVKFTGEGGSVSIETACDAEAGRAYFSVSDNGIGVAPEDLHRLFKPFVQVDSRLAREHSGTGLGLSLVQQLAELHAGGVSVETEPGRGSRFTIALPWDPEAMQSILDRADDTPPDAKTSETVHTRTPASGETRAPLLLLVDDHEPNVRALGSYLTAAGYRVAIAHSGLEAIERVRAEHPSLIVMDIQMPGIDGLETTRRIHAMKGLAGTPVVALTALAMPNDRQRSLDAGIDEYVTKPVRLSRLASIIERMLAERRED
jgi:PAS domain S-box-containing protein